MKKDSKNVKRDAARQLKVTGELVDKARKEVEGVASAEIGTLGIWCDLTKARAKIRRLRATTGS